MSGDACTKEKSLKPKNRFCLPAEPLDTRTWNKMTQATANPYFLKPIIISCFDLPTESLLFLFSSPRLPSWNQLSMHPAQSKSLPQWTLNTSPKSRKRLQKTIFFNFPPKRWNSGFKASPKSKRCAKKAILFPRTSKSEQRFRSESANSIQNPEERRLLLLDQNQLIVFKTLGTYKSRWRFDQRIHGATRRWFCFILINFRRRRSREGEAEEGNAAGTRKGRKTRERKRQQRPVSYSR